MEPATAGAEILTEAYNLITGDRQNAYNHPLDDYTRTVDIFRAITGHHLTAEQGILFMIAMKLSRLANELENDLDVPDNATDTAGYIGCLRMAIVKRRKQLQTLEDRLNNLPDHFKTGETTWV